MKMICTAFSKGRFVRPSLKSKNRIKGSCNRRLKSQKPASSGTCNDTHDEYQISEVQSSVCINEQVILLDGTTVNVHFELCKSKGVQHGPYPQKTYSLDWKIKLTYGTVLEYYSE